MKDLVIEDQVNPVEKFTALFHSHGIDPLKLATAIVWRDQDQKAFEFYSQFIKPGDLCFDIGACVGVRTKVFLRLGASVVTVEPQARCMRLLQAIYSILPSASLVHKGVAEAPGYAELYSCDIWEISSLDKSWLKPYSFSSGTSWDASEGVELTTLDNLIAEYGYPDFVKVDVEGSEFRVLSGLSQRLPCLSFEFTTADDGLRRTARCLECLSRLGNISLNYSIGESMVLSLATWVTASELLSEINRLSGIETVGDIYAKMV